MYKLIISYVSQGRLAEEDFLIITIDSTNSIMK